MSLGDTSPKTRDDINLVTLHISNLETTLLAKFVHHIFKTKTFCINEDELHDCSMNIVNS